MWKKSLFNNHPYVICTDMNRSGVILLIYICSSHSVLDLVWPARNADCNSFVVFLSDQRMRGRPNITSASGEHIVSRGILY